MKTLSKLFVAMVALFAYACATDATEDLGVKLDGGQTEITLSLEESRTQLGEKVEGVYPLYWSEGDAIAVNGVPSEPLTKAADGASAATFVVNGEVAYPHNIVYPAPAEGVTAAEGLQAVTFLAEQPYVAGSFAEGAAPMYALVTEGGESTTLSHLAGVLRFAVKGEGVTLTSMSVSSESGKIAGNFDVNCADGTLTAHADATNVVSVTFGEGLTLGAEATPIYVAVPAGNYGTFAITLRTANDKMTVKFDSEVKPINVGSVREFAPFTYAPNQNDSEEFIIETKEDLIEFASIASTFYPHKTAKLVANIDMTGVEWSPIVGFGSYTFDGGNFEIKGLTAPLFEETSAAIKNLKLTDVNITETVNPNIGAIVRNVPVVEEITSLTNCSASGTIVVNCENYSAEVEPIYAVGGLLGSCRNGIPLSNCTNNINIDVQGISTATASTKSFYIGGVAGYNSHLTDECTNNGSVSVGTLTTTGDLMLGGVIGCCQYIENLTNSGAIAVSGTYDGRVFVGGVVGYSMTTTEYKCIESSNSGAISINKSAEFNNSTYIGGVVGCSKFSVENCTNSGNISIAGTYNGQTYIAGNTGWAFASLKTNKIVGADNSGDITITGDASFKQHGTLPAAYTTAITASGVNPFIAGCIATGNTALDNSTNSGNITIEAGEQLKGGYLIGGLVANTSKWVTNCENSGDIEIKEGATIAGNGYLSGGVAISTGEGMKNVTNRGAINIYGTTTYRYFIGGCLGQSCLAATAEGEEIFTNLKNYGQINLKGTMDGGSASTNVGGVICYINGNAAKLYNYAEATITVDLKASSSNFNVGGIVVDADSHLVDVENHADINISGPTAGDTNSAFIGGLVAQHANASNRTNCINSGNINFSTTSTPTSIAIGGLFVSGVRLNCLNCHNSGNITVGSFGLNTADNKDANFTCGGIFARLMDAANHVALSNCTNSGNISIDGSNCDGTISVGGIFANMTAKATTLQVVGDSANNIGLVNSGNITVKGTGKTVSTTTPWLTVGGIFAQTNKAFVASGKEWSGIVKNTGNVDVTISINQNTYIGGLIGLINNSGAAAALSGANFTNTGNVTCSGVVPTTHSIGGLVGLGKSHITNASVHCDIQAYKFTKLGIVTGGVRSDASIVSNCKLGGRIATSSELKENADGDGAIVVPIWNDIDGSNFYEHIYSLAPDWSSITNYDGCSYLSAKPE